MEFSLQKSYSSFISWRESRDWSDFSFRSSLPLIPSPSVLQVKGEILKTFLFLTDDWISLSLNPSLRTIWLNPFVAHTFAHFDWQVVCGVGRENIESWGRRRKRNARDVPHTYETDDEMTLSREILVLDINDPADASRSTMDPLEVDEALKRLESLERCSSRNTVVALSVISALLVVIYVCTVAYFTASRRTSSFSSGKAYR